jgi:hypothetical protein
VLGAFEVTSPCHRWRWAPDEMLLARSKINSTTRCLTDFIGATLPLVKIDENDGEGDEN